MACKYEAQNFSLEPMGPDFFDNEDYLRQYQSYEQDPRVTAWNSHGLFYKTDRQMQGWMAAIESGSIISWAIMVDGKYVGVCSLDSINHLYKTAEVTIFIGDIQQWGRGIATEAIGFMLQHGFLRLGLNRIWSGTAATNEGMNRVFERLNFVLEGSFRQGMFLQGAYVDVNEYAILRQDWDCYKALGGGV